MSNNRQKINNVNVEALINDIVNGTNKYNDEYDFDKEEIKEEDEMNDFANDVLKGVEAEIDLGIQSEPVDLELEAEKIEEIPEAIPVENEPELNLGLQDNPVEEIENPLEEVLEEPVGITEYKSSRQNISVKTYLERYRSGKITVPSCQRSAGVWKKDQEDRLVDTMMSKLPIPAITLGEVEGQSYVVDGLQRTTALEHLLSRKDIDEETKKKIQSYQLNVVTVHEMDWVGFEKYFYNCNNGTPLASAVKECASLPAAVAAAVNEVANNSYFYEGEFGRTTITNDHKRVMSMSMLLAATGLNSSIKAKELAKALTTAENLVVCNTEKAKANMNKVIDAFKLLKSEFVKRGFNANYVCTWGYLLVQYPEITAEEIAEVTMRIFAKSKAIPAYSKTTGNGSAGWKPLQNRINVVADILDEFRKEVEAEENEVV